MSLAIPEDARAIIFDLDGTLVDTMPLHLKAWQRAMRELGGDITADEFWGFAGIATERIIELLNQKHGWQLPVIEGARLKERYFWDVIPCVKAVGRVVELVDRFTGKLPLAVATGGQRYVAQQTLASTGLMHRFRAVVCADDVLHGKPYPDMFELAARQLRVAAWACVVVEDADNGIEAARRAGMRWVDVRV